MDKMITRWLILLTSLHTLHCFPQKLPSLEVSSPQEVNSLEREEPFRVADPQNIDDTVKEVEDIIKSNPALPRLTRGEILDLLENITTADDQKVQVLRGRQRDPKAVMVVMPYTPTNDKNMEDLFTKAPVTHIIGAEPFKPKDEELKRPPDSDNDLAQKPLRVVEEKKKYSASINSSIPPRNTHRRRRPEATTPPPYSPTTYRPRKPARTRTTQHPNHRYTEGIIPNQGIHVIDPPDLDLQEAIKQEVFKPYVTQKPLKAKTTTSPSDIQPPQTSIEDINFPNNLKTVVKDLNLEGALNPPPVKVEDHNRIKTMLASIGVLPRTTTTTTTTSIPNAEGVADSLSPDMRDLLMSFGLLPNPNEKPARSNDDAYYPDKAEVKPESYVGFKPLPDDGPSRQDMDALLASFGLGRSARREKSIKINKKEENEETYNFEMIPEDLKGVVKDLGIDRVNRESKKIRTTTVEKTVEKQHVFNPDTQYATEEELKKLDKLLSMIKQLEKLNGTATEEDLKKIDLDSLKELVSELNGHNDSFVTLDEKENSPDPTAFDLGEIRNEVKRQESTTTAKTVVEAETPSIKDLEASFGGQTEAATEPPEPETTTLRRTGFYRLVDWNTFLDIDDTKGKRVNLRFQPHIGDPKRFYSISVP